MKDPVERFLEIRNALGPSPAALSEPALHAEMTSAPQGTDLVEALSTYVANNSTLTKAQAKTAVQSTGATANSADASKVSKAASAAAGFSADVSLSDPVMLDPVYRVAFSGVFAAGLAACIGLSYLLATDGQTSSAWPFVPFAVGAAVTFIGILVLVMGYKTVDIKGGS